jgi:hypothetical protein
MADPQVSPSIPTHAEAEDPEEPDGDGTVNCAVTDFHVVPDGGDSMTEPDQLVEYSFKIPELALTLE